MLLALLTVGCIPHGPLSIEPLLPPCDGPNCRPGLLDRLHGPSSTPPTDPNQVAAPFPKFHPVPTRPVFTPWAETETPAPSGSVLTWNRALAKPTDPYAAAPPVGNTSPANDAIARRTPPERLQADPYLEPLPSREPPQDSPPALLPPSDGWRAVGPRL